jgi:hypothetical protein
VGGEEEDDGEHPAHVDERRVLDSHLVDRHYATAAAGQQLMNK